MKKFLSLLLSTIMTVSMCTVSSVSAYDTNTLYSQAQTQQQNSDDSVYGDFQYTVSDGKVTITNYTGSAKTLSIPSKIDNKPVTNIGDYAFFYCSSLTNVTIPNSVIHIGNNAFSECSNLTSVNIPNSVTSIGYSAFGGCSSLTSVTIPGSVTNIASNTFSYCKNLSNINVSTNNSNFNSINGILFNKNKTTIICYPAGKKDMIYKIPISVKTIGNYAFSSCISLINLTIPTSVTSIGEQAFEYCNNLTDIDIPNSVTNIDRGAFYGCINLKNISLPNNITDIKSRTFEGCESLSDIIIPSNVNNIGEGAFGGCESLKSILIPDNVITIGLGAFSFCNSLKNIIIPKSVKDIERYAFQGCTSLLNINVHEENRIYSSIDGVLFSKNKTEIICYPEGKTNKVYTIPNNVIYIGDAAFKDCDNLTSVIIPNSTTNIGDFAFEGCIHLISITIPQNVTNMGIWSVGYYNGYSGIQKISGFKIYGYKDSAAETYANDNGFEFVYISAIAVTGISLNKTTLSLDMGKSETLTATVIPSNATNKTITWSTSNSSVATVSNGTVKAVSSGTATITATTTNGKKATCKITVIKETTNILINKSSLIVGMGETFKFSCQTDKGTSAKVIYTSSKTSVATVDSNGNMKAKSTGTAIITATTDNGKTAKCRVTVKKAPTSISINRKNSIMGLGETFYLEGSLANDEASRVLTFSSNKPEVATVTDGGIVTAKSIGTAIVSITTYNGQKATCRVTVRNAPTSLQFNKTSITLKQGETFYLESQFNAGEYARTVIYNSPNKTVATISGSGVIMAKSKGTVKITGKTYNGKTQTCTVTVK